MCRFHAAPGRRPRQLCAGRAPPTCGALHRTLADIDRPEVRLIVNPGGTKLCAIHPDAPFDFSEKAVLLPRDVALKAYVDQW